MYSGAEIQLSEAETTDFVGCQNFILFSFSYAFLATKQRSRNLGEAEENLK